MMKRENKPVILTEQMEYSDLALDPLTKKICISLPERSGYDNRGEVDSFRQTLAQKLSMPVDIPFSLMSEIAKVCRSGSELITLTLAAKDGFSEDGKVEAWQLIDIESEDKTNNHLGLAIDIGTTTVVVYLVDMYSGKIIDRASDYNGQIKLGDNILSRIMAARTVEGLQELQHLVIQSLNGLIKELCEKVVIQPHQISAASIGANTTMIHLLLGLDPSSICREPYIPIVNNPGIFNAKEIGLAINPLGPIYCLPSVGSYIGGDVIAGILVSGMHNDEEISLLADIGTNGEFVIGNREWLVACAGAAGPALEGGVTECGMRAEAGAIDHVEIGPDGEAHYTTIENAPARGICGSGLVDCLAELFLNGIINRAAHFVDGRERFVLVSAEDAFEGKEIFISQNDINSLMRTKGAVNAALEVLVEGVGCGWEEIKKFYSAGAFGQYLPLESAITVGLYPDLPREKMIRLGNSSGEGARLVLLSNQKRWEVEIIAARITYFEMNANASFMEKYRGSKFLPHTNIDLYPSVKEKLANFANRNTQI